MIIVSDRILMDDLKGRSIARRLGIRPLGTLAVIEIAAERGLVSRKNTLHQLRQTNFHITDRMIQDALTRSASREQ
ncbi:MAG: hypothetical protein HY718_17510 [Planctomycetes bacterium]|nr:hypothetical protein [Planctomycetota bacterium]